MDTVTTITGTNAPSLRELAARVLRVLFEPARFFRHDLPSYSLSEALAFGIGNAWLASAFAFFFQTINTLILTSILDRWMQRLVASEEGFLVWGLSPNSFLWASGLLLLAPFLLVLRSLFASVGLYLFSRLLIEDRPGAPEPVTFRGAYRIQAVSLLGQWFSVVPVFGSLLSLLVSLILVVTGVRERFQVSTRRAAAVVLAPYALLALLALLVLLLMLVLLAQVSLEEALGLAL